MRIAVPHGSFFDLVSSPNLRMCWFPRVFRDTSRGKELDKAPNMARGPREEIAGGTFHVMNRGNRKALIFEDDQDRRQFLRIQIEEKQTHGVEVCGGCQMGTHFHVIVTTPNGNLSDFVGAFEGRFAAYSNWRHGNVGHLFQGRFRDVVIEDDVQLLTALCYVFLNPVSAGFVKNIESYRWSTYRATVGLDPVPSYLSLEWLETLYPGKPLAEAQRRFRDLMNEAQPVFAYFRRHDAEVDPDAVKRVIRSYVGERLRAGTLPRLYRSALRAGLPELFRPGSRGPELARSIHEAHVVHGYRLVEIARHLRMHRATTSRIFNAFRKSTGAR
jgi:putative transposase